MKTFYFKILVLVMVALSFPIQSFAFGATVRYGGYVLFTIPCTCSAGTFLVTYAPLHVEGIGKIFAQMVISPTVQRWAYEQFVYPPIPTTWQLGEMTIGGECLMTATPCIVIPAYGTVTKTGASYPGFSPL